MLSNQYHNQLQMNSIILKLVSSQRIKDIVGVSRGIYKVLEGSTPKAVSPSWHDIPQHRNSHQNMNRKQQQKQTNNHEQNQILKQDFQQAIKTNKQQKKHNKFMQDAMKAQNQRKIIEKQFIQSSINSSRAGRFFQFGKIGLHLASSYLGSKIGGQLNYQEIAKYLSDALCKMRGAPLKLAQMLSIQQDDLIPPPIRKAFQKARQTSHVITLQQVQFMMSKNFGSDWRTKFKSFEDKPFASASIGQVHRAVLHDNKKVAVKIQYPGVRQSINSDLNNLGVIMKIPGLFPKGIYIEKVIEATRKQLMQQCNYLQQMKLQTTYAKTLKAVFNENEAKLFKVPECIPQLTTETILTTQYVEGITMVELQEDGYSQQLRNEIGRRIMQLTFKQLFEMGIMQSDPNPSNFTYNIQTDELNLLDFGATHIYDRKFLQGYYKIIKAGAEQNDQVLWDNSITVGFATGQQSKTFKETHIQSVKILADPLKADGIYDFGVQKITEKIYKTIPIILKNRLKHPPQQVYSLHRKFSGAFLASIRLKSRFQCCALFKNITFKTKVDEFL